MEASTSMESNNKKAEWAFSGREGAGLKEEYGEEWTVMIVQDGQRMHRVDASYAIIHAPHPKGNGIATFIQVGHAILEVRAACRSGRYNCWFYGDYCQKDGSIIIASQIDPLFLALPSLEAARNKTTEHAGRFTPRHQMIADEDAMGMALQEADLDLQVICDTKEIGGDTYFRLNDEKVLLWLRAKVSALIGHKYHGCDDSLPAGGWTSVHVDNSGIEDKIASLEAVGRSRAAKERHVFAISLVCEYISTWWTAKLLDSYEMVPKDLEPIKVQITASVGDEQYKSFNTGKSKDDKDKVATAKKPKPASSKLANVNTKGMMSMSSFFKPQPKS